MHSIGIDIGTQSVKVCHISQRHGELRTKVLQRNHGGPIQIKGQWFQDREIVERVIEQLVSKIGEKIPPNEQTKISISCVGEAFLTKANNDWSKFVCLGPAEYPAPLNPIVERLAKTSFDPRNSFFTSYGIQNLFAGKAVKIGTWDSYLAELWCGKPVVSRTVAIRTGMYCPALNHWNEQLVSYLNLEVEDLPQVCCEGVQVGRVSDLWSRRFGIRKNPLLVCGGWDQYLALLSTVPENGDLIVNFGSVLIIAGMQRSEPIESIHSIPRINFRSRLGYITCNLVYSPGIFQKRISAAFGQRTPRFVDFDRWECSDSGGQRFSIDDSLKLFCPMKSKEAVFKCSAFEVHQAIEKFYPEPNRIFLVGGGATSPYWRAVLRHFYGKRVLFSTQEHASSMGAALLCNQNLSSPHKWQADDANTIDVDMSDFERYLKWKKKHSDLE